MWIWLALTAQAADRQILEWWAPEWPAEVNPQSGESCDVKAEVDATGAVRSAVAARTCPRLLRTQAEAAVARWRFAPQDGPSTHTFSVAAETHGERHRTWPVLTEEERRQGRLCIGDGRTDAKGKVRSVSVLGACPPALVARLTEVWAGWTFRADERVFPLGYDPIEAPLPRQLPPATVPDPSVAAPSTCTFAVHVGADGLPEQLEPLAACPDAALVALTQASRGWVFPSGAWPFVTRFRVQVTPPAP